MLRTFLERGRGGGGRGSEELEEGVKGDGEGGG